VSIFILYKPSFNIKFLTNINAYIAHIGVGIFIIGVTVSSVFKTEENYFLSENEIAVIDGFDVILKEIKFNNNSNFQELRGLFSIQKNNNEIAQIEAGKNYYFVSKMITTEAGIFHDWLRDIYIILGDKNNDKWLIKIYNNPLVSFIWIGILIIILSGLIGILKK